MRDPGSCLDIFPNEAERAAARARWKAIDARHPGGVWLSTLSHGTLGMMVPDGNGGQKMLPMSELLSEVSPDSVEVVEIELEHDPRGLRIGGAA